MKQRLLCIDCWRVVPVDEAWYECPHCGTDSADPWTRGFAGRHPVHDLRRPLRPLVLRCPDHPETQLQLFCACGARLPRGDHLNQARPQAVGIAGPKDAGKSHYLVAMVEALRTARDPRGRSVRLFGLGDTENRFSGLRNRVLVDRRQLNGTVRHDDAVRHFAWEVLVSQHAGRTDNPCLLLTSDLAGETWEHLTEEVSDSLDRYLSRLGSLIFLVDGARVVEELTGAAADRWDSRPHAGDHAAAERRLLRELIERLEAGGDRRMRIAIVVAKSDLIWRQTGFEELAPGVASVQEEDRANERDRQRRHAELVRELLCRSGREQLLLAAEKHFHHVGLFAASSLGFSPGPETLDEEGRFTQEIEPHGVVEPILWLLNPRWL